MKIFMLPSTSTLGIGRVVEAYRSHLPAYGVQLVDNEHDADLVVCHAGEHAPTRQTDVLVCHGLYPTATLDRADGYFQINASVVKNAREALVITVPSNWVASSFQRDMHLSPRVVPHGINASDWPYPNDNQGYVLWAKGHNPGVVDAGLVNQLAARLPDVQFVSTMGQAAPNVKVMGVMPFDKMKQVIRGAGAYLSTTRETFGIQTLEAMACGVPVVGYKHGATPEIVDHGWTGWLSEPGDIDSLAEGVRWALQSHDVAGAACRAAIEQTFTWDVACDAMYDVLLEAVQLRLRPHKVSVIIPCYNYGKWLSTAVDSVLAQTYTGPLEIIIVDDGSTDNTKDVAASYGNNVRYLSKNNAGVASARNHGIMHATGDLVACLDADDWWEPGFLSKLVPPMLEDRSLGLVYGGLQSDNGHGTHNSGWPPDFDFRNQATRHNCVPSSCLFRRSAWERAGGYRAQYTPAEDAELWLRIAAVGYNVRKVTPDVVYSYRLHSDSLSRRVKEPDWVSDKPYNRNENLTPFAAPGGKPSHPYRDYDDPWVSVVIPVGPGHEHLVHRAIDSLEAQSMVNWEVIVVNDSGTILTHPNTGLSLSQAYPYIIEAHTDRCGAAAARNTGAALANSSLLMWLDADDWLLPDCLSYMVQAYNDNPCRYVYSDWLGRDGSDGLQPHISKEFSVEAIHKEAIHPITCLVPKQWSNEIGGFDASLPGWEDWAYYLSLVHAGHCGVRVPHACMVYDYTSGTRRDSSLDKRSELLPIIRTRYSKEPTMACGSCGKRSSSSGGLPVPLPAAQRTAPSVRGAPVMAAQQQNNENQMVLIADNTGNIGGHGVVGIRTRINYGRHKHGDVFPMHVEDQRAQPQRYVIVPDQVTKPPEPQRPVAPAHVNDNPPPIPERPTAVPQDIVNLVEQPVPDDEIEVDITILPLVQIKQLGLTADDAQAALELERAAPKPRASVIEYLTGLVTKK